MKMNRPIAILVIAIFGAFMISTTLLLPEFGSYQNKGVADYYLGHALEDTGSANTVNSIVWDYRSYDTLGEETVLIIATIGIVLVAGRRFV
jgi:multisubunit Na+/H+ antiporter MnhB subunit